MINLLIFILFTVALIYLKKYNHLLIITLPYLTTLFFTDIQNTNQGKEIFDLFFIFLLILYILISIISKVFQKYKNNIFINNLNIISVSVIWCVILFIDIIANTCNDLIIIDTANLIMIFIFLWKSYHIYPLKKSA